MAPHLTSQYARVFGRSLEWARRRRLLLQLGNAEFREFPERGELQKLGRNVRILIVFDGIMPCRL